MYGYICSKANFKFYRMYMKLKTLFFAGISAVSALMSVSCGDKEELSPTAINFDRSEATMNVGDSLVIEAVVLPPDSFSGQLTWESSDETVASVKDGLVTAIAQGEAVISAHAGDISAQCAVTVQEQKEEITIVLDRNEITLSVGGTATIQAIVLPEEYAAQIEWASSDDGVVSVDGSGIVTALAEGEADITASIGDVEAACHVTTVPVPVERVILDVASLEMNVGDKHVITATVEPDNATYRTVSWTSSDEAVATVDENGEVTAAGFGNAVITATADGVSAECEVEVIDPNALRIGNYYYSDGTWSLELDSSREVIGVVFWVGDPSADDASLKRDHPECVNGLAVSMGGDGSVNWQTGYKEYGKTLNEWVMANLDGFAPVLAEYNAGSEPDYMNMILGYNNTRAMEEFNAAPENSSWPCEAVRFIKDYAETVPLPEWCSGWYLPSIKELSLLCSGDYAGDIREISYNNMQTANRDFINERLLMVEGANHICTTCLFWSSTECSQPLSYCNHFEAGLVFRNNKASLAGGAVCRTIFAF